MSAMICPKCGDPAVYSKKRGRYFCAECELEFDAPTPYVIADKTFDSVEEAFRDLESEIARANRHRGLFTKATASDR